MLSLRRSFAALTLISAMVLPLASHAEEARTWTKEELQKLIQETIMSNPDVIISSVEKMQVEKQKAESQQAKDAISTNQAELEQDKQSPTVGPKDADVTVVEFFDYNCGYCKQSLPNVMKLLEEDKKVRVVFKEFPVIAASSEIAARAALAVNAIKPEKYLDYHAALFKLGGRFDEETLKKVAEGFGINGAEFTTKLNSPEIKKHLEDNMELGKKLGNRGVPVFIVGDEHFPGAIPYDRLKSVVEENRSKS